MTDRSGRRLLVIPLLLLAAACGTDAPTHQPGPAAPVRGSLPPPTGSDAPGLPGVNPPSSSGTAGIPKAPAAFTDPIDFPRGDPVVSISVPQGWEKVADPNSDQRTDFVDPTGQVFLRLDSSPFSGDSARGNFAAVETDFQSRHPSYERISLHDIPCPEGASECADWEFTFDDNGTPRHVIDRAYVSDDGIQIALYYSAPQADRDFDNVRPAFDHAAATLNFLQ
jgi:hypothetical protein